MAAGFPRTYLSKKLSEEQVERKRSRGHCVSHGCHRRADKRKGGRCNTCSSRLFRLSHDAHYAFYNLKTSARKRGIGFHLTFAEFMAFCATNTYLSDRGTDSSSATIDRIKSSLPYQAGNLRILTHADNSAHIYDEPNSF